MSAIWIVLKRWRFVILGLFGLVILAYVADPIAMAILHSHDRRRQLEAESVPHWRRFTNTQCGYVVEFPSKPFENPYTLSNQQNVVSYRQFASVLGSNQSFLVATLKTSVTNNYSDEQIEYLLNKSARGAVDKGDEMLSEREVRLEGNIGKEIEIRKASGDFAKMRFYQVDHNLQEVVTLVPASERQSTNISYFLESFRLISE